MFDEERWSRNVVRRRCPLLYCAIVDVEMVFFLSRVPLSSCWEGVMGEFGNVRLVQMYICIYFRKKTIASVECARKALVN